jgi:hypothetical protein
MPAGKAKGVVWVLVPFGPGELANPKEPRKCETKGSIKVRLHRVGAPAGKTMQDLEEDVAGDWEAFPSTSLSIKPAGTLNYALKTGVVKNTVDR